MSSNDYIQGSQIDSCLLLSEGCTVETRLLQLIGNIAVNFGEDPIKKKKNTINKCRVGFKNKK